MEWVIEVFVMFYSQFVSQLLFYGGCFHCLALEFALDAFSGFPMLSVSSYESCCG